MNLDFLYTIAQLETQNGKKTIKGPNGEDSLNLFNIKQVDKSAPGFAAFDKAEGSNDRYRVYGSRDESANDFVGLLERKYPKAFDALTNGGDIQAFATGLKEGGYATDPKYVEKVVSVYNSRKGSAPKADAPSAPTPFSPEVVAQTKQLVLGDLTSGTPSNTIVGRLAAGPVAPMIKTLREQGTSDDEIVSQILGPDADKVRSLRGRNPLANAADAAGNRLSDMGLAARQMVASGPQEQALRQEAARRQQDPERMTLNNTMAGQAGSLLPDIGLATAATLAAPFSGGTSLALGGAIGGAASGALTPTQEDGERSENTLVGGLLGAGGAALPGAAGAVGRKVLGSSLGRSAEKVAERTALAQRLQAEGLPVNAATLTEGGRNLASRLSDSGAVQAFRTKADDVLSGKVADGLGLKGYGGAIDTEMLNTARPMIKRALDDATDLDLTIPQSLKADVQALVTGSKNPLTSGVADAPVVARAAKNIADAADSGAVVSGRQLQELMSELKAVASSQTSSATERQAAGQLVGKLNDTLKAAMTPEQQAKFIEANRQYANLKAVEKMVSLSNDTGVVTPRQMIQAVKTGRFKNSFLKDEAPFQELSTTAAEALTPANGRGLADVLGRAVGTGDSALGAATVLEPVTGASAFVTKKLAEKLLAGAITSENPTLVRLLTGVGGKGSKPMDPAMKKYIAAALAGSGSALAAGG